MDVRVEVQEVEADILKVNQKIIGLKDTYSGEQYTILDYDEGTKSYRWENFETSEQHDIGKDRIDNLLQQKVLELYFGEFEEEYQISELSDVKSVDETP